MLKIKNVTMKYFMSVGAVTQAVNLEENGLTLILGDNVDLGSAGSRNGTGKTVLLHAISYGLFGYPMTNIRKDNLINKTNSKNMLVSVEFEKDGHNYKIERGRKPMLFKYIVDNNIVNESNTDEAQGDSRTTQEEINTLLGFSHLLFKHIVSLSTKTTPFLNEKAQVQREMIEELLGITQLSVKAETLRENMKETRSQIDREEMAIQFIKSANENALKTIEDFKRRSMIWETKNMNTIKDLERKINRLMEVHSKEEIEAHKTLEQFKTLEKDVKDSKRNLDTEGSFYEKLLSQTETTQKNLEMLLEHKCHACGQAIHDEQHEKMLKEIENDLEKTCEQCIEQGQKLQTVQDRYELKVASLSALGNRPDTFYNTIEEAYEHKNNLEQYISELEKEVQIENPYIEQIDTVEKNNLQEVDYETLNELSKLKEHQEFLLKVLTDKKSWVRKQIIEQNLGYLNQKLAFYLEKLGLPHQVRFLSDLSVEIIKVGESFDFDNLSTGESTRLVLALSWAFRDTFEIMNFPISIMFIDELIDNGMDTTGGEHSLAVLKHFTRELNRNAFLVSHKDEFIARVSNVLMVVKENGFTSYNYETDMQL